ncbi:MAG: type II secretion system inner membrane protein GspF [Planctomycetota bacterium]|nr:type II secretion system inner membrane protein GspF [Planctomycetota bacterium]
MAIFEYKALDTGGGTRGGIVDADSPREARLKLRGDGIHVTEIHLLDAKKGGSDDDSQAPRIGLFAPKANPGELSIVTRQLSTLLSAGISAVDALKAIIEQVESRDMEKVLRDVREKVTQGDTLGEALGRHPRFFNELFCNMVKAGEASGQLDTILTRLASYIVRQNRLRQKLSGAMTYPVVMIIVGTLVVTVLMTFVVPKLTTLFKKVGEGLPAITQALISISQFFQGYWWSIFVLMFLAWLFIRALKSSEQGLLRYDRARMRLPIVGDLLRKTSIARFANTMATLLQSGIPVLESLKIVQRVVNNAVLAKTIGEVHDAILEGSDIATPLQESGVFPPMVGYMIATGEQSGQLEELLETVSDAYDEEIDMSISKLISVLEPVIIIILAGVVLFVVAAIMIPLIQMGSLTRGA